MTTIVDFDGKYIGCICVLENRPDKETLYGFIVTDPTASVRSRTDQIRGFEKVVMAALTAARELGIYRPRVKD